MVSLALRTMRARRRRLLSSALAIVLGVAFLVGTLVLGDTLSTNFTSLFNDVSSGTDVVVRVATSVSSSGAPDQDRGLLDGSLLGVVEAVDGVAGVEAQVVGYGALLGRDGDPVGGNGPPRQAGSWVTDPALNPYQLVEGRAPAARGEVVVNRGAAVAGGLAVGDATVVQTPQPVPVTVVGIATFGGSDGLGQTTWAAFTLEGAQADVTRQPDRVSTLLVTAGPGVEAPALRDQVAAALPPGIEAITGTQLARERIDAISSEFLTMLRTFLTAFASIALLVATLTITNTFTITLAHRTSELALLRLVGASRRQLRRSVSVEAALLGLAASLVGVVAGLGVAGLLKGVFDAFGGALPAGGLAVRPTAVAAGLAAGTAVTVLAAQLPARRAARIPPVAALRSEATAREASHRRRVAAGAVLLAMGLALTVTGAVVPTVLAACVGALLLIAGTIALSPAAVRPIAALLDRGRWGAAGGSVHLAAENARRSPRRTASTATALVIGVSVVSLFTVFAASLASSVESQVDEGFGADLAVNTSPFGGNRLSPSIVDELRRLPEVERAVALGGGQAVVGGRTVEVTATDIDALPDVVAVRPVAGSLASATSTGIAVDTATAETRGWSVGTTVPVAFSDGATVMTRIEAVYESNRLVGSILVPASLWAGHTSQPTARTVFVDRRADVPLDAARRAVVPVAARHGGDLQDRDEYAAATTAGLDMLLGIVYVLLALAVLIALLGIANTLSLAVHERRREIGLLRAVGQTRRQVRSVLRLEAVLVSLLGTLLGLGLGGLLGWALFTTVSDSPGFTLPATQLAVITVLGGLAGLVAARRPARRAARLPILDAIGST